MFPCRHSLQSVYTFIFYFMGFCQMMANELGANKRVCYTNDVQLLAAAQSFGKVTVELMHLQCRIVTIYSQGNTVSF